VPSWHRPGSGKLPVLVDPYGGAGSQRVTAELDWKSLVSQWFAEQGFAVLVADGSGTPGRDPDFEREVYGDLFGPVLDDQVAALHEAARLYPDLDLSRVGIRGWSFSGSIAAPACCGGPMSSAPPWPARELPTSCRTTRTGASGSSAIPPSSRSGTRRARWCGTHPG
jgi:dipeptidyl-peptidase-4